MYTLNDARRECKELFDEGYGFGAVRIFIHDLARGKDITWDEAKQLFIEIMDGKFGNVDIGIPTI